MMAPLQSHHFDGCFRGVLRLQQAEVAIVAEAVSRNLGFGTGFPRTRLEKPDEVNGFITALELTHLDHAENLSAYKRRRMDGDQTNSSGSVDLSGVKADVELGQIPVEQLEVRESATKFEQDEAFRLHLSKNTFHEERELVRLRVYRGAACGCRTWLLLAPGSVALAAVTLRINAYRQSRSRRWAQVLNMSTRRERHGLGTTLVAGLEELLVREQVDALVLYPAENGRAPAFWSSLGFGPPVAGSILPPEELVSWDEGGPLLPEFDPGSLAPLPRWEKRLPKRRRGPKLPSLGGDLLHLAATELRAQRATWKASLGAEPRA